MHRIYVSSLSQYVNFNNNKESINGEKDMYIFDECGT